MVIIPLTGAHNSKDELLLSYWDPGMESLDHEVVGNVA